MFPEKTGSLVEETEAHVVIGFLLGLFLLLATLLLLTLIVGGLENSGDLVIGDGDLQYFDEYKL